MIPHVQLWGAVAGRPSGLDSQLAELARKLQPLLETREVTNEY